MKSLSLKIDESIISETDELIKGSKVSRNQYITQAIAFYNQLKKRKALAKKMKHASLLVSKNSMEVLKEFENLDDEFED